MEIPVLLQVRPSRPHVPKKRGESPRGGSCHAARELGRHLSPGPSALRPVSKSGNALIGNVVGNLSGNNLLDLPTLKAARPVVREGSQGVATDRMLRIAFSNRRHVDQHHERHRDPNSKERIDVSVRRMSKRC